MVSAMRFTLPDPVTAPLKNMRRLGSAHRLCVEYSFEVSIPAARQWFSGSTANYTQCCRSELVKGHKLSRWPAKEMPPELRQLLARFGKGAISHFRYTSGVV